MHLKHEQAERIKAILVASGAPDDLVSAIDAATEDPPIIPDEPAFRSRTRTRDFEAVTKPIPIAEIRALASRTTTGEVAP